MGDLSLPCFAFAKQLGMAPNLIAEQLQSEVVEPTEVIDEINSRSGYLNFKVSPIWLASYVASGQIRVGDATGEYPSGDRAEQLNISANPNGPFHFRG